MSKDYEKIKSEFEAYLTDIFDYIVQDEGLERGEHSIYKSHLVFMMFQAWLGAKDIYEQKWISVDDGLPNKHDLVLACDYGYVPVACQYDVNARDGKLLFFTIGDGDVFHPTHWMPLPKPPAS